MKTAWYMGTIIHFCSDVETTWYLVRPFNWNSSANCFQTLWFRIECGAFWLSHGLTGRTALLQHHLVVLAISSYTVVIENFQPGTLNNCQTFTESHSSSEHCSFTLIHLLHVCRIQSKTFCIIPLGILQFESFLWVAPTQVNWPLFARNILNFIFRHPQRKGPEPLNQEIVGFNLLHN